MPIMCGRYSLKILPGEIASAFEFAEENLPVIRYGRFNIAPSQEVLVLRLSPETGEREMITMRWGLVPGWAKEGQGAAGFINARAETVAEKPSFRGGFRERRCLVIADGFYEWQKLGARDSMRVNSSEDSGAGPGEDILRANERSDKQRGTRKQPYYFRLRSGCPFAFAGIYEEPGRIYSERSCAIITTEANGVVHPVHERMPVMLTEPDQWQLWLNGSEPERKLLLRPLADELLDCIPVSSLVNNPRNDVADCVTQVGHLTSL